jgi:hypothetical protein
MDAGTAGLRGPGRGYMAGARGSSRRRTPSPMAIGLTQRGHAPPRSRSAGHGSGHCVLTLHFRNGSGRGGCLEASTDPHTHAGGWALPGAGRALPE